MTDPIIIERSELVNIARNAALLAIKQTLRDISIRRNGFNQWITQNQAFKLIGRRRLERTMSEGRIKWHKSDLNKRNSKVLILRNDFEKLINNGIC